LRPTRSQSFTTHERFNQTIETVKSAINKVPNCVCVLIEGSELSNYEICEFSKYFHYTLLGGNSIDIQKAVNDPRNIGHGECKLLEHGCDFVIKNLIPKFNIDNIFKLSARYTLSDNFDIKNFSKDKFTLREHYDSYAKVDVYTTALYSIPPNRIEMYRKMLKDVQNVLSNYILMVERVYHIMIPRDDVHLVDTLGFQGMLSYNKKFVEV
jgi:hypothetical protein